MGCFKSSKAPVFNPPAPVHVPSAQDLFASATNFGKTTQPLAYGAREGALADLSRGQDYYSQFQPTSMESALASQYFSNVMPDIERSIKQNLSLSGMANSPALADLIAKQRGQVGFNVGSYLADQGNQRAQGSLNARLGIDPFSTYGNYLNTDIGQSTANANMDNQFNYGQAYSNYQVADNAYNRRQDMASTLGFLNPIAGAAYGGPAAGLSGLADQAKLAMSVFGPALMGTGMPGGYPGFGGGMYGQQQQGMQPSAMPVYGGR